MVRGAFIPGHARPKGSLDAQQVVDGAGRRTGRVRLVDTPQSRRWRRTVAKHVQGLKWAPVDGPCSVSMAFYFDPAKVWPATWRTLALGPGDYPIHAQIGDLDKLVRNVLDALQDAGTYANDRQVAQVDAIKRWSNPDLGEVAGLSLLVEPMGWPAP